MTMNIVHEARREIRAGIIFCLLISAVWPSGSNAQEFSYDGKRWFEVEVSVFTNEYPASEFAEQPVAKNLSLQYFPKLQHLLTPISSLMIDFPEPESPISLTPPEPFAPVAEVEDEPAETGPIYSPALPEGFKVNDYARDAFIALTGRLATFNSINRNLADSSEHDVLWHQVWRQPLLARAQTPAIFVVAGEQVGTHTELEGSLRLSDISGQATLDINLWLNRFGISANASELEWTVPNLPLPLETDIDAASMIAADPRTITEVWQLQQTRALTANELYYFDHPAFGVLVQIRPYVLPEQPIVADEGDF